MKTTITAIKADIGSIGGHICPSKKLLTSVENYIKEYKKDLIVDYRISYTGDDIAFLFTHFLGKDNKDVHKLAWDTFKYGSEVAESQGLYGAGQDLLKDSFSGNVKGMGPAVAELSFKERPNEPFLFFAADKTDPGAYNLPMYLSFSDPMYNSGLILSSPMSKGFRFKIMDVSHTENDRLIELNTPEDLYDIASLLRDPERFVVESIDSVDSGEQAVSVSTTRLRNIAGKYTGKDDPIALVRVQGSFPATGEVLAPYNIGPYVAGFMRGSHTGPLMPVKQNTSVSFFDGPPVVSCAAYCVRDGILTEPVDAFDHPYWDQVRTRISEKATEIRKQGFFGNAMLPYSELEYGGIVEKLDKLEQQFYNRDKDVLSEVEETDMVS
ncbi:MAG: fructose 1,6-bisphosphatase [Desulfobacterales bacterium]|nr:fructose 1,6-bisphosphatase [Desulfobacterales bacterium]MCP4160856.1 fructose 1,6-bisphosphatase [Deltaproteobacteria bacterium]